MVKRRLPGSTHDNRHRTVGTPTLGYTLGLPPVPVPKDNPQSDIKIKLGDKLFHDTRFSATGDVSCSTCHERKKTFTDSPLRVSEGIKKLKGTRNAPTVVNAAYMESMFWDGREGAKKSFIKVKTASGHHLQRHSCFHPKSTLSLRSGAQE